ncbi:MAG: hypothetical protein VB081_11465 [Christensenella sp.]|uniref:hypothetical protein n=1 Tax=Christensenella sp. TaxID=1935934 RepID=UPI002B20F4D0|nr:hypothetical protein [Christensenella sp.]MEA5004105.1 hypothetical protein [Christensenella sp.]
MKRKCVAAVLFVCALFFFAGCGSAPQEGLDVSGTYVGKETYIAQNPENESGLPDVLTFDWIWTLEKGENGLYRVTFEHEATPAVGSIAAMEAVKTGINNVPLTDGSIGIPNYVYLTFEEKDNQMTAYGTFNVLQSTGEVDVRVISLVRIKK